MFTETKKDEQKKVANNKKEATAKEQLFPDELQELQTVKQEQEPEQNEPVETVSAKDEFMKNVPEHDPEAMDNYHAMFATLKKADVAGETIEATGTYLDLSGFKLNEKRAYIFKGMTTFVKEGGETIPAAMLMGEDKESYIIAGVVITGALAKVPQVPIAVMIQCNGKKKGKAGNYWDVKITY